MPVFRRYLVSSLTAVTVSLLAGTSWAANLTVAFNSDWAPFSKGPAEDVGGILPDLVREILSRHMDTPVDVVGYPWARVQHLVEKGKIDAFVTVPTAQRLKYALTSKEDVYKVEMRPTVKRGSPAEKSLTEKPTPATLRTLRYCDILGNGWGKSYAAKNGITPIIGRKVVSCLRMVQKGRVDVTLQSSAVSIREIAVEKMEQDLVTLPDVYGQMSFTLLVSKKSAFKQDFINRFDKTLQRMKADGSYDELIIRLHNAPAN